jgi:sulfur relay protein TusB/DsrH
MLHTLSSSANSSAFADCLRLLCAGDALVLIGDGVYCAIRNSDSREQLLATKVELYVLRDDAVAAGITASVGDTPLIDIDALVSLSEQHERQQAWF